jgi:hypothetical protein
MEKTRINDYVRVGLSDRGLSIATRASTDRGSRFGDAQSLSLEEDETEALYEILKEHYEEDE